MAFESVPIGVHALLDFHGARGLEDLDFVESILRDAASAAGATILGAHMHHFGEGFGVTGVVLLAESHMSIHTWPEHDYAAVDIFLCGGSNLQAAIEVIEDRFEAQVASTKVIERGEARLSGERAA
ncbi:adenosylmethionine decarboxylase [Erythrobacter sp. HKB08]|uniref:adenosylmethionine decarboxylase n=1 Tax=Erythrobacter sp. HKB08 TaxID=2502843 RepID=UPI001008E462|nr:adenosylmethionine decarboxylase [Erythrobacter sp. HKB08]